MSSSIKIDDKKKVVLILSKGPSQVLKLTLSAEKMYSINFTEYNKKICLNCIITGKTVIYLLMVRKFINLKQKIFKL